jgi:carbonic anhydrase
MGNLTGLLGKIRPAVFQEKTHKENRHSKNQDFVDAVTNIHTERSVQAIIEQSSILADLIDRGEAGIIGAMYDVETGTVTFHEHTRRIGQPLEAAEQTA